MMTFDPKWVTAHLAIYHLKGQLKTNKMVVSKNCQKQSVHILWSIKYHWFNKNFPKNLIFEKL